MRRFMRGVLAMAVFVGCGAAVGCGGESSVAAPVLPATHPCDPADLGEIAPPSGVRFSCSTLSVPLDHGLSPGDRVDRRLSLQVAMTENPTATRGILVWLSGGPGGPGARLAGEIATQLDPAVLREYRLVMFSQRGTGPNALRCPQLQRRMLSSLLAPPADAVTSCAQTLGPDRRFFSTADSIADLDQLRETLGVEKLTLIGASYGTLVAARYAVTHPDRVARVVLDSVVPHDGLDPFMLALYPRASRLLRATCARSGCPTDPAQDLATVVRVDHNGPQLLDTLTELAAKPGLADFVVAVREAARGERGKLDGLIAAQRGHERPPPVEKYSRALNVTTGCQEMHGPWSDAATPAPGRAKTAQAVVATLPDQAFFPFDRATALENGTSVTCQVWPETPAARFPVGRDLPAVPALLLAGERDLTTPLAWTQQEAAHAPKGRLMVVPGAGHITQDIAAYGPAGRDAVTPFLTEEKPS